MSFGSDSPGGSAEGIGGNESGIGGDSDSGSGGGSDFGGFADEYGGFDYGGFNLGTDIDSSLGFGSEIESIGYSSYGGTPAMTTDISQALAAMSVVDQESLFRTTVEPTLATYQGWQGQAASKIASTVFGVIANGIVPGAGTLAKITGLTGYLADKMMDASFANDLAGQLGIRDINDLSSVSAQNMVSAAETVDRQRGGDMGIWEDITGRSAAGAATGAAQTQAGYQQQALDYLKSRESVPLEISGGALQQLGGLYGLPGGVGDQQAFIDQARQSPLYGAIVGGREQGEEAIMRHAGMTGGLRSGNVQENLYDYNTQLENRALMGAYGEQLGGLQFLAQRDPSGQANIANMMSGIGGTLAGGQIASEQARQSGTANLIGLGGSLYQAAGGASGIWDTAKDVGAEVMSWF